MLHDVVLTQYWRVTDGRTDRQTDRRNCRSTALAIRALRRDVKTVDAVKASLVAGWQSFIAEPNNSESEAMVDTQPQQARVWHKVTSDMLFEFLNVT